jgi:mRNA interferase MazF
MAAICKANAGFPADAGPRFAYIAENAKQYEWSVMRLMERKIRRGDMFYADPALGMGSEQSGSRPVLIVSNNTGNKHSRTVIAAVITGRAAGKAKLPTHCLVRAQQGLGRDSCVLLEQIRTIDKARLREYIGTLDGESMGGVDRALAVSVGLR